MIRAEETHTHITRVLLARDRRGCMPLHVAVGRQARSAASCQPRPQAASRPAAGPSVRPDGLCRKSRAARMLLSMRRRSSFLYAPSEMYSQSLHLLGQSKHRVTARLLGSRLDRSPKSSPARRRWQKLRQGQDRWHRKRPSTVLGRVGGELLLWSLRRNPTRGGHTWEGRGARLSTSCSTRARRYPRTWTR